MKEHPILFSTPMVQANREGRKTMTRRIINQPISEDAHNFIFISDHSIWKKRGIQNTWGYFESPELGSFPCDDSKHFKCPYGKPGDLLWVRESFALIDHPELKYRYKADHLNPKSVSWKPSIHMPKSAARIWLQVEEIRVERLNEISEEDAIAEGILHTRISGVPHFMDYRINDYIFPFTAKDSFRTLFLSINGKPKPQREFGEKGKIVSYTAVAWDQEDFDMNWAKYHGEFRQRRLYVTTNPWVWVVKYKVLSTTGKPQICYKTNEVCKYDCKGLCRESM